MHMYVSTDGLPRIGTSASSRVTRVKSLIRRRRVTEANTHAVGLAKAPVFGVEAGEA